MYDLHLDLEISNWYSRENHPFYHIYLLLESDLSSTCGGK